MNVLDLFSGLGGWASAFRERGHDVRTLDLLPEFGCTYTADILKWDTADLGLWRPHIICASPPCEGFTVMRIGKNWTKPDDYPPHAPKTDQARLALALVERTREVIADLDPAFFVIENPVAKLRKLPVLADLERREVWYCHLGETNAKPTDLWGGFPPTLVLPGICHQQRKGHRDDCCCKDHTTAPRGSRTPGSVQGKANSAVRAEIPHDLSLLVCEAAERDLALGQDWRGGASGQEVLFA